jgi:hypothetical protein
MVENVCVDDAPNHRISNRVNFNDSEDLRFGMKQIYAPIVIRDVFFHHTSERIRIDKVASGPNINQA